MHCDNIAPTPVSEASTSMINCDDKMVAVNVVLNRLNAFSASRPQLSFFFSPFVIDVRGTAMVL